MSAFLSFHAPGFWLVIAFLAGIVALGVRPYLPQAVRLWIMPAYWVLIPYFALITGGVSPRLMGIAYIDWASSMRLGVGLALGMIALAVAARVFVLSSAPHAAPEAGSSRGWTMLLIAVLLSGAEELFWCFLRGSVTESLALLDMPLDVPGYWAVWIAALLALPLILLNERDATRRLVSATILVMTSILFFYTRNFWLCWGVHAAVWLLLVQPSSSDNTAAARG